MFDRQTDRQTDRQSYFELLRIVLMLMIVAHHFFVHGGFSYADGNLCNRIFLLFFGSGGKIGVSVFLLISGYFLIKGGFHIRKLIRYVLQIWTYSLAILGVAFFLHIWSGSTREWIRYVLPLGYMNWFAHYYLLLFLFVPFLNVMLLHFDKILYKRFLLLGFFLWYLIPTVTGLVGMRLDMGASLLLDFFYLYALGAFIRLYGQEYRMKNAMSKAALGYAAIVLLDFLITKFPLRHIKGHLFYFAELNSVLVLGVAVCLFLAFKQLRIGHSQWINRIAATTFGIYLLHDNDLLRKWIWQDTLQVSQFYTSEWFPLYAIGIVLFVFCVCGILDFLRIRFLETYYLRWIEKKQTCH